MSKCKKIEFLPELVHLPSECKVLLNCFVDSSPYQRPSMQAEIGDKKKI